MTSPSPARRTGARTAAPRFGPEALAFLRALARNNRREWFQPRKDTYDDVVRGPMVAFVERLRDDLAVFAPDHVADPRVSIFRIYRDTRFSADKTPYKTNVAAYFPHAGMAKGEGAGFYIEVAPRHVWYGGGIYMPTTRELLLIRQHLAANQARFERLLQARAFRREFGALTGDSLQRVPRGFPADHPAADWLKRKQFLAGCERPAEFATSDGFYRTVVAGFRAAAPVLAFLNDALTATGRAASRGWSANPR